MPHEPEQRSGGLEQPALVEDDARDPLDGMSRPRARKRLTSAEANRLLRETEMSIKRRGEVVDRLAAVLILQNWMENRARLAGGG